jgi:hypothetical protein
MPANNHQMIRLLTLLTAAVFFISAILNLGARIPLGFGELSFSSPLASTATDEAVIGLVLVAAAAASRLYVYGGAYALALVGIVSGLLSPQVQGPARDLHEVMAPLAIGGCLLLALEARSRYRSRAYRGTGKMNREVITVLQFFVGGLVVVGGIAFASSGTYPLGTALGLIHLSVGLAGLIGGYAFLRRKAWSRRFLIAVNGLTITYSAFSESIAQVESLLPPGINDSLIGTLVAVIISATIICLLYRRPEGVQTPSEDHLEPSVT